MWVKTQDLCNAHTAGIVEVEFESHCRQQCLQFGFEVSGLSLFQGNEHASLGLLLKSQPDHTQDGLTVCPAWLGLQVVPGCAL